MALPFASALAAVRSVLGVPITYRRGSSTVSLTAVRGQRDQLGQETEGNVVANQLPDWLAKRTELGALAPPQAGDVVEYQPAVGSLEKYRVAADDSGRVYATSDPEGSSLRIHTVRIT